MAATSLIDRPQPVSNKGEGPGRPVDSGPPHLHRAALLLIAAMWTIHFLMMVTRWSVNDAAFLAYYSVSRLVLTLFGAILSYAIYDALRRLRHRSFALQATVAALASAAAAIAVTAVNIHAFRGGTPGADISEYFAFFLYVFMYWYWFYLSWSAAYLALSYSFTVADQERRAHIAQMRALRYQLNPHFLFNALNSIASLIEESPAQAEQTVVKLSDLLRTSLAMDPLQDLRLDQEFGLQTSYLELEQTRFPNRLRVEVDLPEEVRSASLPCMLLQPLVENAIKHGVARSAAPTTVRLKAWREKAFLIVQVSDNAGTFSPATAGLTGTGIGLSNVRNRLQARFGKQQSFECRSGPDGFSATIRIPFGS